MSSDTYRRIYAVYGEAVIIHNSTELFLKLFLACELAKTNNTQISDELKNIEKDHGTFGAKVTLFKNRLSSKINDPTFDKLLDTVKRNRDYLSHAALVETGTVTGDNKIFKPSGLVFLEFTQIIKGTSVVIPETPITEQKLTNFITSANQLILVIHKQMINNKPK